MCVECAHVAAAGISIAALVLPCLKLAVTRRSHIAECDISAESQMSQMRVVAFPACRSEAEHQAREVFSPSTGRCAGEKPIECGAETNGDAS